MVEIISLSEFTSTVEREIAYVIEFTNQEWRNLWRVILVGSAMSECLNSFSEFHSMLELLSLRHLKKPVMELYEGHCQKAKRLQKIWLDQASLLNESYQTAAPPCDSNYL
jgi:hypothetical protein